MIISVLNTIVGDMNSGGKSYHFDYGQEGFLNLIEDEAEFPGVLYNTRSVFDLFANQTGYISETYKPNMFFLFKSELEWTPEQHDVNCIQPAIKAAKEFVTRCQNANDLINSIVISPGAREHINLLDANASGIEINFEIQLKIEASICVT